MTDRPTPPFPPRATYRLQFGPHLTFADAALLVPYLDGLGISHVYASPVLAARPGSSHGYDITDHNALNSELGDEGAFRRFAALLHERGMGLILDFVPNHMGIGHADNRWWLDVLEWGEASPYAEWFDIDWAATKSVLRGKVLLPFLGNHYGQCLENGDLHLIFNTKEGSFDIRYHDHRFPISPPHYGRVLAINADRLGEADKDLRQRIDHLVGGFRDLRPARASRAARQNARKAAAAMKARLAEAYGQNTDIRAYLDACLARYNAAPVPGTPPAPTAAGHSKSGDFLALHRLLQRQPYRLAYWRVAASEINYRRFFDINDLAGLRVEREDLFETIHRLALSWVREGVIDGLRIDHIDGLFDPRGYCARLRTAVAQAREAAPHSTPFYLVVEKILEHGETLRRDWQIDGTTGYEAGALLDGIFVAPAEKRMDQVYRRFSQRDETFEEILYDCKYKVMTEVLAAEMTVLVDELDRIAQSHWRSRDFTREGLRAALMEVVASFPVYRTYVTLRGTTADDRIQIDRAVSTARRANRDKESSLFSFIHGVLTGDLAQRQSGYRPRRIFRFAMKFQQFTGPVMAKSMEDTAFYRYCRLVSLNEVGNDPRQMGIAPGVFHDANLRRLRDFPATMLATTTHDTKRGEDTRARLNVLSELADPWRRHLHHWARLNRRHRVPGENEPIPNRNDEYFLYQTLLGAWPAELSGKVPEATPPWQDFRERIHAYMIKALREAKSNTSWTAPDTAYEDGVGRFIDALLAPGPSPFLETFLPFQIRLDRLGRLAGLARTGLKLTLPGVPDLYQGSEEWVFSLVDPDNRRPVDFSVREKTLAGLSPLSPAHDGLLPGEDKFRLSARLLAARRDHPALFSGGHYTPLFARPGGDQDRSDHVLAFRRDLEEEGVPLTLVVAVPRLLAALADDEGRLPPAADLWKGHTLPLGEFAPGGMFYDIVGACPGPEIAVDGSGPALCLDQLFASSPVAVLLHRPV